MYPHGSATPSSSGFLAETAQKISGAGDESRKWFEICWTSIFWSRCARNLVIRQKFRAYMKSKNGMFTIGILLRLLTRAQSRYTNCFQFLYRTIEARLKGELASTWEDAKIEYIFSVPTT